YLGASSVPEHERLYLSVDLKTYVEIPTSAILHRMAAPTEQDPLGAVTLWVKNDAKLIYQMTIVAQALAHFFAGNLQAGAVAGPPPFPGEQGPIAGLTYTCYPCWYTARDNPLIGHSPVRSCYDPECFRPPVIGHSQVRSCYDPNCIR